MGFLGWEKGGLGRMFKWLRGKGGRTPKSEILNFFLVRFSYPEKFVVVVLLRLLHQPKPQNPSPLTPRAFPSLSFLILFSREKKALLVFLGGGVDVSCFFSGFFLFLSCFLPF